MRRSGAGAGSARHDGTGWAARRPVLPFRSVNRSDCPGYVEAMQRHHLLPRSLLARPGFRRLFEAIGQDRIGFDDFRRNGLLLPATGEAALRLALPLHRGPHRAYNAMVAERFARIEGDWARSRLRSPQAAREQALMRIGLLQRALRRRLLEPAPARIRLNSRDPLGAEIDFAELDAMAEALWASTAERLPDG